MLQRLACDGRVAWAGARSTVAALGARSTPAQAVPGRSSLVVLLALAVLLVVVGPEAPLHVLPRQHHVCRDGGARRQQPAPRLGRLLRLPPAARLAVPGRGAGGEGGEGGALHLFPQPPRRCVRLSAGGGQRRSCLGLAGQGSGGAGRQAQPRSLAAAGRQPARQPARAPLTCPLPPRPRPRPTSPAPPPPPRAPPPRRRPGSRGPGRRPGRGAPPAWRPAAGWGKAIEDWSKA